jgi:hypothetical protein
MDEDADGAAPSGVTFDALSGESVAAASLAAGGVDAAEVASGFEPAGEPGGCEPACISGFEPAACAALSGLDAAAEEAADADAADVETGVAADGVPDVPALSGLFSLMTICQARLVRANE